MTTQPSAAALQTLKRLTPTGQRAVILAALKGEEGQLFRDIIEKIHAVFTAMPKTYETDGQGGAAAAIAERLITVRKVEAGSPWPTPAALTAAVSQQLRSQGIPHAAAQYDAAGLCLTCGKTSDECPGVHTFVEIQTAARKAEVRK